MKMRPTYFQVLEGLSHKRLVLCVSQGNRTSNSKEKVKYTPLGSKYTKWDAQ